MAHALSPWLAGPLGTARSNGIDIARAVLALWVVFAHAFPWAVFAAQPAPSSDALIGASAVRMLVAIFQPAAETHPAVAAFIVLSGYCIHRNGLRADRMDLAGYARRRIFRILPIYLAAVASGVVVFFIAGTIDPRIGQTLTGTPAIDPAALLVKLTGASAVVPSWHVWSFQGNAPLTTVMVEMWLYALYAAVLWLIARGVPFGALALAVATIATAVFAWCGTDAARLGWWYNGSLAGFVLVWWIGAAAATYPSRVARLLAPASLLWLALTIAIMVAGLTMPWLVEARRLVFAMAVAGLCLLLDRNTIRGWQPIVRLGEAGYSIYALHGPLLVLSFALGLPWWIAIGVVIVTSLAAYHLIEAPLTAYGRATIKHNF